MRVLHPVLLLVCLGAASIPSARALEAASNLPTATIIASAPDHATASAEPVEAPPGKAPAIYTLPLDKLEKAHRLAQARTLIYFGSAASDIAALVLILVLGWAAGLRDWAARITPRRWLQGFLFLPALLLLISVAGLPFSVVGHHLSLVYGLSIQRWGSWLWDWTKGLALTVAGGTLALALLAAIIRRSERRWWLWFWAIAMPLQLLVVFLVPVVIDPMFDHFEPLTKSNPALVDQLQRVVARSDLRIPPSRMFLMRASEKVTGLNAYVTGIGASKRVVVWDTTIAKCPTDEILFIFGHEQGHYVLNHIWIGLVAFAVGSFAALWLGFHLLRWMVARWGRAWGVSAVDDWAAITMLLLASSVFGFFGDPVSNAFSRVIEHHADIYGQEVIHGLVDDPQRTAAEAFQKLGELSLDEPDPNHFLVLWSYSHPSISRRQSFAAQYDPWRAGTEPRYFSTRPHRW